MASCCSAKTTYKEGQQRSVGAWSEEANSALDSGTPGMFSVEDNSKHLKSDGPNHTTLQTDKVNISNCHNVFQFGHNWGNVKKSPDGNVQEGDRFPQMEKGQNSDEATESQTSEGKLRNEIQQLSAELTQKLQTSERKLKNEIQQLSAELTQKVVEIDKLKGENEKLWAMIHELHSERKLNEGNQKLSAALIHSYQEKADEKEKLEKENEKTSKELRDLTEDLNKSVGEKDELCRNSELLTSNLNNLRQENDRLVKSISNMTEQHNSEKENLENFIQEQREEIESCRARINVLTVEHGQCMEFVRGHEELMEEMEKAHKSSKIKSTNKEKIINEMTKANEDLEIQIEQKDAELNRLRNELTTEKEESRRTRAHNVQLHGLVLGLHDGLRSREENIQNNRVRNGHVQESVDRLNDAIQQNRLEIERATRNRARPEQQPLMDAMHNVVHEFQGLPEPVDIMILTAQHVANRDVHDPH